MASTLKPGFNSCVSSLFKFSIFKFSTFTTKIIKIVMIYLCFIISHYVAAHLYTYYCVPASFLGFIQSVFLSPMPHCTALRWVIYYGGNSMSYMWILLGAWIMSKMGDYMNKVNNE